MIEVAVLVLVASCVLALACWLHGSWVSTIRRPRHAVRDGSHTTEADGIRDSPSMHPRVDGQCTTPRIRFRRSERRNRPDS